MPAKPRPLTIESAEIVFRNFSGKETKFNPAGRRNFCVFLDEDSAEDLKKEGWNVKYLKPREPEDSPRAYIQIAVSFENRPPNIMMITGNGRTNLDEDSVGVLDWADIRNVDLIIRPYAWDINGNKGIKGYVKSMYITIDEDEFASKYYDPITED